MSDEIRQVAIPTSSPTCCIRCQSHVGPFADLDVELFDGNLYLCKLCADGVTRAMDGCSAEERAGYETRLADAADEIERLRGDVTDAKRTVISELLEFQKKLDTPAEVAS